MKTWKLIKNTKNSVLKILCTLATALTWWPHPAIIIKICKPMETNPADCRCMADSNGIGFGIGLGMVRLLAGMDTHLEWHRQQAVAKAAAIAAGISNDKTSGKIDKFSRHQCNKSSSTVHHQCSWFSEHKTREQRKQKTEAETVCLWFLQPVDSAGGIWHFGWCVFPWLSVRGCPLELCSCLTQSTDLSQCRDVRVRPVRTGGLSSRPDSPSVNLCSETVWKDPPNCEKIVTWMPSGVCTHQSWMQTPVPLPRQIPWLTFWQLLPWPSVISEQKGSSMSLFCIKSIYYQHLRLLRLLVVVAAAALFVF